jgi:hypothetical protein
MRKVLAVFMVAGAAFGLAVACDGTAVGTGTPDGGAGAEAGSVDAGEVDSGDAGDAASSAGVSLATFCGSLCSHITSCDTTKDAQICASACENDNAAGYPKRRANVVDSALTCFSAADCVSVLRGTALSTCVDVAAAAIAPSAAGVAFCSAWSSASTTCGRTLDQAQCLSLVKQYNDDSIARAQACTTKTCANVLPCIEAEFNLAFGGGPSGVIK